MIPLQPGRWIALVSRAEAFPATTGAGVKLEQTIRQYNRLGFHVCSVTDRPGRYEVHRADGTREIRKFAARIRRRNVFLRRRSRSRRPEFLPHWIYLFYRPIFSRDLARKLEHLARIHPFELLQAEFPAYAPACARIGRKWRIPSLLVEHNAEFDRLTQQLATNYRTGQDTRIEDWLTRTEVKACNDCDHVAPVSEVDREKLQLAGVLHFKLTVVPLGVDLAALSKESRIDLRARLGLPSTTRLLAFHGNFRSPPNLEAIQSLAQRILPGLATRGIDAACIAIGPLPSRLTELPGIHFLGPVQDLAPFLLGTDLAALPIVQGGGTRMKLLEYFALGIPVVATSKAVEGIPIQAGLHAVIADDLDGFIEGIVGVFQDRSSIDLAASRKFVERYDWSLLIPRYLRVAGLETT